MSTHSTNEGAQNEISIPSIDLHNNSATDWDIDEEDGDLSGRDIPETSPAFRSKPLSSGV